jgi:hypothetical protein
VTELRPTERDEQRSGAHGLDVDIEVARMHSLNRALQ